MTKAQDIRYNQTLQEPSDLWAITVENKQSSVVFLRGFITSKEMGPVYAAKTTHFQLPIGTQVIRSYLFSEINVIQSALEDLEVPLGEGHYTFQTEVVNYYNQQVISSVMMDLTIDSIKINQDNMAEEKEDKPFAFHLIGDITSQHDIDLKNELSIPSYTRFNVNPSVTLFDIPFKVSAYISTENKETIENTNYFNFHFDYREYQQIIMDKLLKEIESSENLGEKKAFLDSLREDVLEERIEDYKEWKNKLSDPELKNILESLDDIDALSQTINDKGLKEKYNKALDIEQQISTGSLEDLKDPMALLEKNGIDNEKLNKLYEYQSVMDLLQSNGENAFEKLDEIKSLDNPKEYLKLLDEIEIQELAIYSSQANESIEKGDNAKEKSLNKIGTLDHVKSPEDYLNLVDELEIKKVLGFTNKSKKRINKKKEESSRKVNDVLAGLPKKELNEYVTISKKLKDGDVEDFKSLSEEELDYLLKNFDNKQLKNVQKLTELGIDNKGKLKNIGSTNDIQELINISKEYSSVLERYEDLLTKRKTYKKALKVQEEIESVSGLSMQELLMDPKNLKSTIQDFDISTSATKLFGSFRALELGDYYPVYNQLMLNGIKARGANIEVAPGNFYVAGFISKNEEKVFVLEDTTDADLIVKKYLMGTKLGIGEKQKDHLHFNYLYGFEKPTESTIAYEVGANHVFGIDFSFSVSDRLSVEGELNASLYLPNREISDEIKAEFRQKGWAYQLRANYIIGEKGKVYGQAEQVSPFYKTYGLPYLINDRLSLEAGYEQGFLKGQLSMSMFAKHDINKGTIASNSTATSGNVNMFFALSGKPFVNIFYNLVIFKGNNIEALDGNNVSHNISVTTGHNYSIKKSNLTSQLTYAYQYLSNENLTTINSGNIEVGYSEYYLQKLHVVNFSQQVNFTKIKFSANSGISYFGEEISENANLYSFEGTIGIPLFNGKLNTLFGSQYLKLGHDKKVTGYAQASFAVTKFLNFNLDCSYEQILEQQEEIKVKNSAILFNSRLNFNF